MRLTNNHGLHILPVLMVNIHIYIKLLEKSKLGILKNGRDFCPFSKPPAFYFIYIRKFLIKMSNEKILSTKSLPGQVCVLQFSEERLDPAQLSPP